MKEDDLLPHAVRVYEQELKRFENVDSKANQQIGFVGVIIAIFGFVAGDNFQTLEYLVLVIFGLGFLLLSIIISVAKILFPTKKIPVFNVQLYCEDLKKGKTEETVLEVYLTHIGELSQVVTNKARWLARSYLFMLIGLATSFIGILLSVI